MSTNFVVLPQIPKGAQKKKVGLVTVGEKSSDVFNFFLTKKFFNKVDARPS